MESTVGATALCKQTTTPTYYLSKCVLSNALLLSLRMALIMSGTGHSAPPIATVLSALILYELFQERRGGSSSTKLQELEGLRRIHSWQLSKMTQQDRPLAWCTTAALVLTFLMSVGPKDR